MIFPRRFLSASPVALLLLVLTLVLSTSRTVWADGSLKAKNLSLFEKSAVDTLLEKNRDPGETRDAVKSLFPKVRNQHGNLGSLANYLGSLKDDDRSRSLTAMVLIADQQYQAAAEILTELAGEPNPEDWVTSELARVSQLIDLQKTWDLLGSGTEVVALTAEEKKRVNDILLLESSEARAAMKEVCRDLLERYGDLTPVLDYLRAGEAGANQKVLIAIAALADGDIRSAELALADLAQGPDADSWLLGELGRVKEMLGKAEDAARLFQQALVQIADPEMRFALSIRTAQLLYDGGKRKEAAKTLRSVVQAGPNPSVELGNYCARIAALYGDHALVAEWFQPIGEGKALHLNHLFLGESLVQLGRMDEARESFGAALSLAKLPRDRRYVLDRIVSAARTKNTLSKMVDEWIKSDELTPEQLDILINILGGELGRVDELFAFIERPDLPEKTRGFIESPAFQARLAVLGSGLDSGWDAAEHYRDLMKRNPEESSYRDGYVRLLLLDGERAAAIQVYEDAIAGNEESGELMKVAAGARRTGLMEIADQAATKAARAGGKAPLAAGLFRAALFREQGASDQALETLRKLEGDLGEDDADGMMALSEAFERLGDKTTAIQLCRNAYTLSESERILRKLIGLLEQQNLNDEAFGLWRKLWETASEPMTIVQANDRILDLGSRNGMLADLAIELEDRLKAEGLSERELTLLLDIYTSVGDPVSAADVLMVMSKSKDGDQIELYNRMLKVYMESELFGRCNRVLRKLIEIDPENRDEHLQILAVIALERSNNGDAMVVLEELARRTKDGILRDSFSASVLNMLGKHVESARAFRRGLAEDPNDVESWLLWGNALAARDEKEREEKMQNRERVPAPEEQEGNKQTRALFTVMLEEAQADDLFVICVDGLLNARAPRYTMLNALRRLNARIAANPHNLLLYRLAADLNEDINRPAEGAEVLETALTVAGDSRPFIIRELIAMARGAGETDEEIRFGRSLLNITEHLPPAECLSLGTMLLSRGHSAEAEVAFQRVVADANAVGVARDVALRYENSGLFEKAAKVIRSLMIDNPFDVQLKLRLGLLEEKRGDFERAAKSYSEALDLMTSQLPRLTDPNRAGSGKALSFGDIDRFYDLAVRGLLASARTPEAQARLVESTREKVEAELAELVSDEAIAPRFSENPRLKMLARLLRRFGFVFHAPQVVNEMDARFLGLYPGDSKLRDEAAAERRKWQTEMAANRFLESHDITAGKRSLVTPFSKGRESVLKLINDASLSPAERSSAVTLLSIFGYDDLIDQTLKGTDFNRIPQDDGELLVTAGLASRKPDLVRDVLLTNLNRLRRELEPLAGFDRSRAYLRPTKLYKQIVSAWPALSPQDRSTAVNLYGMMLEKTDGQSSLLASYHALLCLNGRVDEIEIERLRHYVDRGRSYMHGHVSTIAGHWFEARPAADRPTAIRQFLGDRIGEKRASALENLARYLSPETLTTEVQEEFPELAIRPWELEGIGEAEIDMVEKREQFAKEISRALANMRSDVRKIFVLHDLTLRPAANMLPRDQLDLLNENYRKSQDPFERLVAFLLLKHAGRDGEAFAMMQDIAGMQSGDSKAEAAVAALPQLLKAYGWDLPALRLMQRNSTGPIRDLKLDFNRHDPLAILAHSGGDLLDADARRIHATRLMASPAQFEQAARIYQADTRHPDVVSNRRLEYKASSFPDRLATGSGGLPAIGEQIKGSILADLVELKGGQDELVNWLRSLTPGWYTNQQGLCRQIAVQASTEGLSPQISNDLKVAAERSALSVFDLALVDALARIAPETLPDGLADHIEELALQDWKGASRWPPRLAEVRKRMGVFEDSAERMASLATICHSLGRHDLGASLGRWSIAMDTLETGSPRHLDIYLKNLPAPARQEELMRLLPFMGLHEARVITGEGLAVLLPVLLDEDMVDAATVQVDRYLKMRLPAISLPYISTPNKALIGGIDSDVNVKDDVVAQTLARLDRPEDYLRLLWKKQGDARYRRSALNLSMFISPMPVMDNTGALPEPSQVEEIGRYLEIHLTLGQRLREKGLLNVESQVAQLCLLGRWCALRDLHKWATTFLDEADELSREMLSGRLWVADLQRLLGGDVIASELEPELLRKNLLPLPRVLGVLESLAQKRGDVTADFAAFRLSSFTNHPEVLKRALRHAKVEELKLEFLGLAERLRQVETLFLPANAPCPFEGYATIADWSAAISGTAATLSSTPKAKPLASLVDDGHPAIARSFLKGEVPEMIYVPIIHDDEYSHLASNGTADIRQVMDNCQEISDRLYKRYGVRHVQLEGLSKSFVEQYNRIPLQRRSVVGKNNSGMIVHQTWTRLLAEKSWVLLPASDRPLVGPLTALGRKYEALIVGALDQAKAKGWLRSREIYDQNKAQLETQLAAVAEEYNAKRRALLAEDPQLKREYSVTVTQRNTAFLDYLLAPKKPGVVFFGVGHWQDIEKQLEKRGVSYAVVVPAGVAWPPAKKDDDVIYDDMLQLGAQLKRCSITLGGGEQIELIIPIE